MPFVSLLSLFLLDDKLHMDMGCAFFSATEHCLMQRKDLNDCPMNE